MKSLPSTFEALVEREIGGGLDALDVVLGGEEAAGLAGDRGAEVGEQLVVAAGVEHLLVAIADASEREVLGDGPVREGDGRLTQFGGTAGRDVVDQAGLERLGGADVATGGHHLERLGDADQAGEALRAAGAGQQAEVDLGQAELRRVDGDAVVRAERDFEAATECGAVDRGDHRDRGVLHRGLDFVEAGCLRHVAAEFADVGAGDEGAPVADHDHGLRPVLDRLADPVEQALANVPAQSVDRRVVDDHQRDVADVGGDDLEADGFRDRSHAVSQAPRPPSADSIAAGLTPDVIALPGRLPSGCRALWKRRMPASQRSRSVALRST